MSTSSNTAARRFEIVRVANDDESYDWAVYDRATRMYAYGHRDTADAIYEEVTSNPDNARHWGWTTDGPFRPIKDMFAP